MTQQNFSTACRGGDYGPLGPYRGATLDFKNDNFDQLTSYSVVLVIEWLHLSVDFDPKSLSIVFFVDRLYE